ncbi:MAG: M23 family metallopeptidase [Spirochaetales bacterium]|nr:M23 family metallopeptidase [Spirochaetales bacterium]
MSPADNYKRNEVKVVEKIVKALSVFFNSILSFFKFLIQKGKQRFTVMFIPHSEKKILNFHISIFSLVFISLLLCVLILGFFYLSTYFTRSEAQLSDLTQNLEVSTKNLETYRDEIKNVSKTIEGFKNSMSELSKAINGEDYTILINTYRGGEIIPSEKAEEGEEEIRELQALIAEIANSIGPLNEIKEVLVRQKSLLEDIPNLWPVYGNGRRIGNITDYFGPGKHPLTGKFRIHKGVDIAWSAGTPIVATANGIIRGVDFNPTGLGNYVTIQHKYGFFTRYGHMQKVIVSRGQVVSRGDIIGYMGSTGLSTGPHVHYEVWMGIQVVDPMQYLDIDHSLIEKYK